MDNAAQLQAALVNAAQNYEATSTEETTYGQLYILDFLMNGPVRQAIVRSSWIVRHREDFPRLTSCYFL